MKVLWDKVVRRARLWRERVRYEVLKHQLTWPQIERKLTGDVRGRIERHAPYGRLLEYWLGENTRLPRTYTSRPDLGRYYSGLLERRIHLFGREYRYPDEVHSQKEPIFGVEWPPVYVRALSDYRKGSDLVLFWEYNKMMFLLDVSYASRAESDRRFARLWFEWVQSWVKHNPYMVGMNWRSPLEVGTRLVVWSIGLREVGAAAGATEQELETVIGTIVQHAEFLAENFTYRKIPNNHLIGEAATLHFFASLWPVFEASGKWERQALQVLRNEMERQTLPDGMDFENAFNYHAYVLDFYLLYLYGCLLATRAPDRDILKGTRKLARSYLSTLSLSGRVPRMGDDSISEFFVLEAPRKIEAHGLAKSVGLRDIIRPELVELFHKQSWGHELINADTPLEMSAHLPSSGFTTIRKSDSHLTFASGPTHETPFSNGHLHADAASFELEVEGTPVFIDSGTYLYFHDNDIRQHFKSARAHNTLVVDDVEPLESVGWFGWRDVPRARTEWFSGEDICAAVACIREIPTAHGAYRHERVLVHVSQRVWVITDRLRPVAGDGPRRGGERHTATLYFHTPLPRDAYPEGVGARTAIVVPRDDGEPLELVLKGFSSSDYDCELVTDTKDMLTWYSPWYGELRHGTTIRARVPFSGDATVAHAIHSRRDNVEWRLLEAGDVGFTVSDYDGRTRQLTIGFGPTRVELDGQPLEDWSRS